MIPDRNQSLMRFWPLPLLVMLGAMLGVWHDNNLQHGRPDTLSALITTVASTPATLLSSTSQWVDHKTSWIFHGYQISRENRRLKSEIAALKQQNIQLQVEASRGVRLSQAQKLYQSSSPPPVAARVISLRSDPDFDTIIINRGTNSSIHKHSVVITPNGLVGEVYEVSANTAGVVLITDPNGMVSARDLRAGAHAVGMCKGDFSSLIPMVNISAESDIAPGDEVVTAGYGVYPPGILIGKVIAVHLDRAQMEKVATIQAAVHFSSLSEVYVIQ